MLYKFATIFLTKLIASYFKQENEHKGIKNRELYRKINRWRSIFPIKKNSKERKCALAEQKA